MPKFLDIALDIGEKNPDTGGIKATNYFEDYLHEIIDAMGGETSESVVTDATASLMLAALQAKVSNLEKELANVDQANQELLPLRSKVSNLEKDLSNVDQANQELLPLRSKVHELERNIANVDQDNQSLIPLRAKVSNLEDEINNLNQVNQTVIPLNSKVSQLESELNNVEQLQIEHIPVVAKVSKLETDNENQDGLIDSLSNDIAYLRQQINMLRDEDVKSFDLEVSKGKIPGHRTLNKFGRSTDVDSGITTDVHDGANATTGLVVWVAPTEARIHQITSTSTDDDGDVAGVGARTIKIWGLTSWSATETSQTLTMDGTSNVATSAYVIIHRMKVLTKGATNVNVGIITATADTDGTVTAQINAGEGQTQMAIYGVPSGETFYIKRLYASFNKSGGATGTVDINLCLNQEPDVELLNCQVKHTQGLISTGSSGFPHVFDPPEQYTGPCIIKIKATGGAANLDVSAGFSGYIVEDGF